MRNFQLQEAKRKKEEEIAKMKIEEQRKRQEVRVIVGVILDTDFIYNFQIPGKRAKTSTHGNNQTTRISQKI